MNEEEACDKVVEIALGSKVKDTVTGLVGTAIARDEHWLGRKCIGIEPLELKDGLIQQTQWVDTHRVVEYPDEP